tara:strand:+ start:94 stop:327 length:234 start_codon:yes stop_codon:yes gene_type:complete
MLMGVVALMLSFFVEVDDKFIANASEKIEQGYSWEYIGRTEWDETKGPAMYLKTDVDNKFVYFKLVKQDGPASESQE